jgi:prephenate dehydrogenase
MKKTQIGIIGGTGGIGKWFAHFFQKEGYVVHVSGRSTGLDFPTLVRKCPVVIVSVPIKATVEVIQKVGPFMPGKSLLMDLTSLKEEPIQAMLQASNSEVIGLHPLFGPETKAMAGHNIVICPARTQKWLPWVKTVFQKNQARIIEATPKRHDEWMAVVQGLNHLNTITMGLALKKSGFDLKELHPVATPTFDGKMDILKKIFGPNSRLYSEIITQNPHIDKVFKDYQQSLSELKKWIDRKDSENLRKRIDTTKLF